jgi:hypothetical protein
LLGREGDGENCAGDGGARAGLILPHASQAFGLCAVCVSAGLGTGGAVYLANPGA